MDAKELDRRKFEIQMEKARLLHNFTKDAMLLTLFMFFIGGLSIMFKDFKITAMMAWMVGIFVVIVGLLATPRVMLYEMDKLLPKEE